MHDLVSNSGLEEVLPYSIQTKVVRSYDQPHRLLPPKMLVHIHLELIACATPSPRLRFAVARLRHRDSHHSCRTTSRKWSSANVASRHVFQCAVGCWTVQNLYYLRLLGRNAGSDGDHQLRFGQHSCALSSTR